MDQDDNNGPVKSESGSESEAEDKKNTLPSFFPKNMNPSIRIDDRKITNDDDDSSDDGFTKEFNRRRVVQVKETYDEKEDRIRSEVLRDEKRRELLRKKQEGASEMLCSTDTNHVNKKFQKKMKKRNEQATDDHVEQAQNMMLEGIIRPSGAGTGSGMRAFVY